MKRLLCSWIQSLSFTLGPPPGVALMESASWCLLHHRSSLRTWGFGLRTGVYSVTSFEF